MGILSRIFGKEKPAFQDGRRIYQSLMAQSRLPVFFGVGKVDDSYEGRIDVLTLHMSIIMYVLREHGDNGAKLSQGLFDAMIDDIDIALRDEGLTDSGVKRRIKPIAKHFYTGLKTVSETLGTPQLAESIATDAMKDASDGFVTNYANYAETFYGNVSTLSLGDIALARFTYPAFSD